MHQYSSSLTAGFGSEMQKIAVLLDPLAAAAMSKILTSNYLGRHGENVFLVKPTAQMIIGLAARQGLQGKPMISRPFREMGALFLDPKLVGGYEKVYNIARTMGPAGIGASKMMLNALSKIPGSAVVLPEARTLSDFVSGVRLESKSPLARAADYMFTPVSQVPGDIASGLRKLFLKSASDPWNRENPKGSSTPLTSSQKASAKARARAAGRPYPNLVDNMAAARKKR